MKGRLMRKRNLQFAANSRGEASLTQAAKTAKSVKICLDNRSE